jgi:hypothetical protein
LIVEHTESIERELKKCERQRNRYDKREGGKYKWK